MDVQPLTREFAEIHNPLLPTPYCEEHYECTAAVSAPSSPFPGDSARRDLVDAAQPQTRRQRRHDVFRVLERRILRFA